MRTAMVWLLPTGLAMFMLQACDQQRIKAVKIRPGVGEFAVLDRKGKTLAFEAGVIDRNGFFIKQESPVWSSSDDQVLAVDAHGTVTAVSSGSADLTASVETFQDKVPVVVKIVGSVELSPNTDQTLKMGDTLQLKATVKDDRGNPMPDAKVVWSAMGYAADVDQTGLVVGQAIGDSVLNARVGNVTGRLNVTVKDR